MAKSESLKVLKRRYKCAKKAWKTKKDDIKLKKAYKLAKKCFREAESGEIELKGKETSLLKQMEKAKAAWKADRSNKDLRKKFLDAKKALEEGGESPVSLTADSTLDSAGTDKSDADEKEIPAKIFCSNVGDDADDEKAAIFFKSCGTIVDTYWLYDKKTGSFRGSGFVTFESSDAALKACAMSGTEWLGKEIKIDIARPMKSWNGKMHSGKSAGIYCGNLPGDVNKESLVKFFDGCGSIVDVNWREDEDGNFKRCAFVTFDSIQSAAKAWKRDGDLLEGYTVVVRPRRPTAKLKTHSNGDKKKVQPLSDKPKGCRTCFVGNLPFDMDEETFAKFVGEGVSNIRRLTDQESGAFRGVCFVDFESEAFVDAFVKRNGVVLRGRQIRIDYGQKNGDGNDDDHGNGDANW